MRVIIAGGIKNLTYDDLVRVIGDSGFQIDDVCVDCSSPTGSLIKKWAAISRIPCWTFAPQAGKYRRLAQMMMDRSMVRVADGLILIWDGRDAKFRNLRFLAKQSGLKVFDQIIENP